MANSVLFCLLFYIALSSGRRIRRQEVPVAAARPPPPPPPSTQQPQQQLLQRQVPQQQFLQQSQGLQQQQPIQNPLTLHLPENVNGLLQLPQQQQLPQALQQPILVPRQNFAPGFEPKPVPPDPGLNQPKVQWFGDPNVLQQQQNLAVIRPQLQQQQGILRPIAPQETLQTQRISNPTQNLQPDQLELRQRIQQAIILVNNAGRDREALLAKINVTGDQVAAKEFQRQIRNLTEFWDKNPFATLDVMKALINSELQLAVDNWVLNEEVAGELAATFSVPRESVGAAFVLTPADVDEMHVAGNNPTASKVFHVKLKELLWAKIDQQYRITTDLLATLSDAMLGLLVGNGLVKEKFSDDIATYFYKTTNRKIKLF